MRELNASEITAISTMMKQHGLQGEEREEAAKAFHEAAMAFVGQPNSNRPMTDKEFADAFTKAIGEA